MSRAEEQAKDIPVIQNFLEVEGVVRRMDTVVSHHDQANWFTVFFWSAEWIIQEALPPIVGQVASQDMAPVVQLRPSH